MALQLMHDLELLRELAGERAVGFEPQQVETDVLESGNGSAKARVRTDGAGSAFCCATIATSDWLSYGYVPVAAT